LDVYVDEIAEKYGLSEKTVRRMLDAKSDKPLTLSGTDALLSYIHQQAQSKTKTRK
jgi:predicted transcriptional regulator